MSVHLKLDAKALQHFIDSEGSDFKIKLSKAVFHTALKNTIKSFVPDDVEKMIDEQVQALGKQIIEASCVQRKNGYSYDWELTPKIKKEIENVVGKAIKTQVTDLIYKVKKEELDTKIDLWMNKMEKIVDQNLELRVHHLNERINKKFSIELSGYIDDAVEKKFDLMNKDK